MKVLTIAGHDLVSHVGDLTDGFGQRLASQVVGVALHHDAGVFHGTTLDDEVGRVKQVHRQHTQTNGWAGIGYHIMVAPSGRLHLVGDLLTQRAHVAHRNHELVGICAMGDFTNGPPALGTLLGYGNALEVVETAFSRPLPDVRGHRDWVKPEHRPQWATSCPGASYLSWIHKPQEVLRLSAQERRDKVRKAIADALRPNLEAGDLKALHGQVHYLTGTTC